MSNESVDYEETETKNAEIRKLRDCILILILLSLSLGALTSLSPVYAHSSVQACPMFILVMKVSTNKHVYSVGEHVIVTWKPVGSGSGQLTLKGPSGTYVYNLNPTQMSLGWYDAGTTQPKDVGAWSAYIQYNPAPGCPPNVYGSTTFLVSGTSPGPACGFILSVAPVSQTVVQGGTTNFALTATPTNPSCIPSSANLNIAVSGLGPGMNYQFIPGSIAITTDPTTPPGVYVISLIMVSSGGLSQQVQMSLTVIQATSVTTCSPCTTATSASVSTAFDYSVTVSPSSQSVPLGGSTSFVVSVNPVSGSPVPVSLTVTGCPADVGCSFTTSSGTPPYTSTLNVDLSNSNDSPGAYTLTVTGSATGSVQSAAATLNIQQASTTTTTTPVLPPGPSYNLTLIAALVAVVALVVVLGLLLMRGRGRQATTGTSQKTTTPPTSTTPTTFCSNCGKENPASGQFCTSCGNTLAPS